LQAHDEVDGEVEDVEDVEDCRHGGEYHEKKESAVDSGTKLHISTNCTKQNLPDLPACSGASSSSSTRYTTPLSTEH